MPQPFFLKKKCLCYHNIRLQTKCKWRCVYTVKPAFAEQMKALADAGYQTILPEQLYNYLYLMVHCRQNQS
jgi:hypothetical protein